MESALRDLVIIARQFSAPAGGITIAAKVDFGRLLLSVHGDGFFLPGNEVEALLEKTGDPYGDSLATSRGLPHVRDVAESHGGSLVIRSARQSGTTFTINIPLDARPYAE